MRHFLSLLLPAIAVGALALGQGPSDARAGGPEDFAVYCAGCHGAGGNGDGVTAPSLDPKPAPLSKTTLTDAELALIIKNGGGAVGRSAVMSAWGTVIDDARIAELVKVIRGLKAEPSPEGSKGETDDEAKAGEPKPAKPDDAK